MGDGGCSVFKWSLIPSWSEELKIRSRMINARSETAHEKPSFRTAFDGFYERQRTGDIKQPFHFRMKSGRPFAFAGL